MTLLGPGRIARGWGTIVNVGTTCFPSVSTFTDTFEARQLIETRSTILARIAMTIIYSLVAISSFVSDTAVAGIIGYLIKARTTIQAWQRDAFIYVDLALATSKAV